MVSEREVPRVPLSRRLGRRGRLIAFTVLAGTVLGLVAGLRTPVRFESEWVVVATQIDIVPAEFDGLAEAVFATETVLQPVIDRVGIDATPRSLLSDGFLEADPIPGATAIRIVGRAEEPDLAAALARVAAETFARVAQAKGLASFEVLGERAPPLAPKRPNVIGFAAVGAAVGALLGLVALLALVVVRQPVADEEETKRVFGAEAVFSTRMLRPMWLGRHRWEIESPGTDASIRSLVRRAAAHGGVGDSDRPSVCWLTVGRRRRGDASLDALVSALEGGDRPLRDVPDAIVRVRPGFAPQTDPAIADALDGCALVVGLVSEGAPAVLLRRARQATELATTSGRPRRVAVLVRESRVWRRPRRRRARARVASAPLTVEGARVAAFNGPSQPSPTESFGSAERWLGDQDPTVRLRGVAALSRMRDERICGALARAVEDEAEEVRTAARRALLRRCMAPEIESLVRLLDSPRYGDRAAAVLDEMVEVASDVLVAALPTLPPLERKLLVRRLEVSGVRGRFRRDLEHPDPGRRRLARRSLRTLEKLEG